MRVPKVIRKLLLQQIACGYLVSIKYNESLTLEDFLKSYNNVLKCRTQEVNKLVVQLEKMK